MSWLSNIGHAVGSVADNKWTKAALAAGLAATGVGAPAAAAIMAGTGALGGALKPGGNLGSAAAGGATGALEGAGAGFAGGTGEGAGIMSKIGGALKNVGGQAGTSIQDTFAPGGKIDFGKVIGTGTTVADMIGRQRQRNSAQNYANSQIDQRNDLMSKILARPNYGPSITPNLNQQSSATSGGY